MSRVITFSRHFPKGHPKAGQPTFFVEKIWKSFVQMPDYRLPENFHPYILQSHLLTSTKPINQAMDYFSVEPKHHTIRAGNRWKVGDCFSPRVWGTDINPRSGRSGPYQSKQITFGPDLELKKVWTFEIIGDGYFLNGNQLKTIQELEPVAKNDGLAVDDFECWFACHPKSKEGFTGQILCWNESINYD